MHNTIIKMLNIESVNLSMYLEDVIIPDLNDINKIIPDVINYTELIDKCLNMVPNVYTSQILESVIVNIKILIENILFEKYKVGSDVLINDVLENSAINYSADDYTLYLKIAELINKQITINTKRYIGEYDYIKIPLEWWDINDTTMLKIIYVYVD